MINYLASFTNTDGASFPNTLGKNSTGPAATDGTEFVKLFIDDIWGARQALMDYTGLTPDSVSEAPTTAQTLEALRRAFGGPGEPIQYMKNVDPAVAGDRVLLLNGQGILRANYPLLDAAVYVGNTDNPTASAFFRADDAAGVTRNTSGVYLILPETRGYVPRGLDVAASVDPDGASRDLGHNQLDAMMRISGFTSLGDNNREIIKTTSSVFSSSVPTAIGSLNSGNASGDTQLDFDSANSTSPNTAKTDDVETRGSNFATTFGIRY